MIHLKSLSQSFHANHKSSAVTADKDLGRGKRLSRADMATATGKLSSSTFSLCWSSLHASQSATIPRSTSTFLALWVRTPSLSPDTARASECSLKSCTSEALLVSDFSLSPACLERLLTRTSSRPRLRILSRHGHNSCDMCRIWFSASLCHAPWS